MRERLPPEPRTAVSPGVTDAEPDEALHYRNAIEAAPIGIICVSGAKGRYVFANETFARMIGRSVDEIMNSDPFLIAHEATHPDDRQLSREAIARMAQGVDRYRYEKRLVRRDGSLLWVAVDLAATRDGEGRMAFLTFYFTDIDAYRSAAAARERLEEQLRQAQKLEALGRLAGGVAHDFNNRLLVIMGYSELLKDALPEESPLRVHTEAVLESADRATDLTRQLLAYSRRQVLKPEVLELDVIVDPMRRLLSRLIGEDIQLVTSFGASHPIACDRGQLEQAIINLALNARDAMPNGGQLAIETNDVTVAPGESERLPPGDYVALSVRDSGSGIPEHILPHIFEPFFTTKEVGRGTGLGLATVEGIVHQSGGVIQVESREGEGARFTIYLPRAGKAPVVDEAPREPIPLRKANFETVLVCDDDDSARQLIANVLALRGYNVLQATSGKHALEVAAAHATIHLLVTDLVMPELGGLELASALRKRDPHVCVLYISGHTEHAAKLSGPLEPGTHFLAKPFLPSDLTHIVCSILERQARVKPLS